MSVIIRLQNLPWSANAMDIRTFFRGLSIPEGGVHIVGGEQGDAFIAFSTDEDARQGMMNDGGKIKEVQVKLLLSSRSEMHKVIESARQSVSFLQLGQPVIAPMVQQPTLPASISGLLAQNMKPLPMGIPSFPLIQTEPSVIPIETISIIDLDKDKDSKRNRDSKGFERKRSRSKSRDRDKKDRSRDKRDRSRSRDRSRDRDRRRRDRSRSRDRRDRKRDRKDRSRERDRKEISDPRLQRKEIEKKIEISNDDSNNKLHMAMQHNFINKSKEGLLGDFPLNNIRADHPMNSLPPIMPGGGARGPVGGLPFTNTRFNQPVPWDGPAMSQPPIGTSVNPRINNIDNNMYPNRFSDNANMDQMHRLQELGERRNPNAFQSDILPYVPRNAGPRANFNEGNFNANGSRMPMNNYMDNDSRNRFNHNGSGKGCCIKVQNLLTSTGYGDIRRFFAGNFISNQGLKIINNENGKRSGTAFVKFCKNEGKLNSLRKNGELLKGRPVVITPLDDDEFDNAIDSYRPNKESEDSGDEGDSQKSLVIVENNETNERNDVYKILVLEDLPAFAKEHDIMKVFSDYSLLSIIIVVTKDVRKQYMAYVQFVNADDAKAALNNKGKHLIGHKTIKVSPCSEAAFEAVKANQNSLDDEFVESNNVEVDNQGDYHHENNVPPISRDPRQRRFDNNRQDETEGTYNKQPKPYQAAPNHGTNPRFQWRGNSNMNAEHIPERNNHMMRRPPIIPDNFNNPPYVDAPRLDCIFLKGLPLRANDRDVLDFFSDVGVIPVKTHLMLTIQGQPSGDCFCEFMEPDEASTALSKHGAMLGGNVISVEIVSKNIVDEARGLLPPDKGFGMRGGFRGRGYYPTRGIPSRRMRGGPAPYNTGSRGGGNRYMGPTEPYNNNNTTDNSGLEGFGVPGCMLSLENVPFRAGIDEILNFFRDFDINQNDVIRRFSDKGNPTGDVRVNLRSPMEAQRALQQLNKLYIRDRIIHIILI